MEYMDGYRLADNLNEIAFLFNKKLFSFDQNRLFDFISSINFWWGWYS